jgi:hypothetical protein
MTSIRKPTTLAGDILTFALFAGAASIAAVACGKSTGATTSSTTTTAASITIAASCDAVSSISTCMDYETESAARSDCPSFGGKVSTSPCTAAGLSGSCAIEGKGIRRYYSTGAMPSTPDYASAHCANAMAGTFTAAPPAGAATAAGGTTAAAPAAAAAVLPEMTQFMGGLDGTSKKVGASLKKYGTKGLKTDDMEMWNLASPTVTATAAHGKQTCYTMDAASGATTRTYELCWASGKIVSVKDDGMK